MQPCVYDIQFLIVKLIFPNLAHVAQKANSEPHTAERTRTSGLIGP